MTHSRLHTKRRNATHRLTIVQQEHAPWLAWPSTQMSRKMNGRSLPGGLPRIPKKKNMEQRESTLTARERRVKNYFQPAVRRATAPSSGGPLDIKEGSSVWRTIQLCHCCLFRRGKRECFPLVGFGFGFCCPPCVRCVHGDGQRGCGRATCSVVVCGRVMCRPVLVVFQISTTFGPCSHRVRLITTVSHMLCPVISVLSTRFSGSLVKIFVLSR